MRVSHLMIVAGAGLAVCFVGASRTEAMTGTAPAAVRAALPELNLTETVHCRPYLHRHGYSRVLSRGCDLVVVHPRRSHVFVRGGVRVREGVSTSTSTTTTRTGASTTVRGSGGSVSGSGQTSGTSSGGASQTTTGGGSAGGAAGAGANVGGTGASVGGSASGGASTSKPSGQ
jgi:hypothetical protein